MVEELDEDDDELAEAPLLDWLLDEEDFDDESDALALAPSDEEVLERESVR